MANLPLITECFVGILFAGFITDDLVRQGDDEDDQKKYMGVCKLPGEKQKVKNTILFSATYFCLI